MNKDKSYEIIKEIESISKLMNKRLKGIIQCKKFTLPALMILHELKLGNVKTLSEVTETLGIPSSTASVIVDRLVNMGIVKRERDQVDRRKVSIYITREGYADHLENLFHSASDEEIDYILKGLKTLENVIMR